MMKRNVAQVAYERDWDEVQRLVKQGENVNDVDREGRTALHHSDIRTTKANCAFLLSRGANVNQTNENGDQRLHLAASHNCIDICQLLVDHRANVTAVNIKGDTPLLVSNDFHESPALCRLLVTNEIVNIANRRGNRALHKVNFKGYTQTFLLLLDFAAEVNAMNVDSQTTLHAAASGFKDRPELRSILVEHNAKIDSLDKDGNQPLHLA